MRLETHGRVSLNVRNDWIKIAAKIDDVLEEFG